MAKVKYYAKEKTMVSTNRPKVLAFASDIVERGLTVTPRDAERTSAQVLPSRTRTSSTSSTAATRPAAVMAARWIRMSKRQ